MILFWMKAFKKPNTEQDEALKQMYLSLTGKNQKKLDRHYKMVFSIYATYTSSSWFGAKPYQRILINMDYMQRLYENQDNTLPTESQVVNKIVEEEKQTDEITETTKTKQSNENDNQTK